MERQGPTRGRRKTPSFSSSLLDAIYHSIDAKEGQDRRNNAAQVEEEIESLRRAIMVEKWMENYGSRHLSSNSGGSSSTDSSAFSSSETDTSSSAPKPKQAADTTPKREGRFTRTKSRAMKIYGDLKKAKEPNSPGGRIASFLNSIFSPRINVKKAGAGDDDFRHVRKSRSMKDTITTTTTTTTTTAGSASTSASCLSKNRSTGTAKSKRSVRFCPVSVILDEDSRPCGHKNTYGNDVVIGSHFVKKNINSFAKMNQRRHELRDFYDNESDFDDRSCASSDLFELENIGRVGMYEEELPVYGTTSVEMNHVIANRRIF